MNPILYIFLIKRTNTLVGTNKKQKKKMICHTWTRISRSQTNGRGAIWSSCTKEDVIKAMEHEPLDMNKHQNRPVELGDRGDEFGYIGVHVKWT